MVNDRAPLRRTRRGCLTCRRRKVKCDEHSERCRNCDRLNLECLWDSREGERLQRSRQSRACARCRNKKLRCLDVEAPQGCRRCIEVGADCIPPGQSQLIQSRPSQPCSTIAIGPTNSQLPNRQVLTSLLDSFFDGPHRFSFYTFLRRAPTTTMLTNGLIPRPLLLLMSATALRIREPRSPHPDNWADEARELLVRDVFRGVSATNLQALLLLQRHEWHRGSHVSAWFVAGLAFRLATALQLTRDPSEARGGAGVELPIPVVEMRRRLVWSCFAMDSVPDVGDRPGSPSIEAGSIKARLPCDEESYELGVESRQPFLHQPVGTVAGGAASISAFLVRVVLLRLRVLQFSYPFYPQSSEEQHTHAPWSADSDFNNWKLEMDDFGECLSASFPLDIIHASSKQGFLIALFTVHAMYHAAYTDLLRSGTHNKPRGTFDTSDPVALPFFEACRRGRVERALRIAEVVSTCMHSRCEQHDPFMAICSCLALRILVVERWHRGKELINISSPAVQDKLDNCRSCAVTTAHWSRPIRRLLFAVGDLLRRHGYDLRLSDRYLLAYPKCCESLQMRGFLTENGASSLPTTPKEPARAGTPGLQIYGTAGTISLARKAYDLESAASQADDHSPGESSPTVANRDTPAIANPSPNVASETGTGGYPFLQDRGSSRFDDLELSGMGYDGVYGWELGQMDVGWADFDMRWIYGLDQSEWGAQNDWGMEGLG